MVIKHHAYKRYVQRILGLKEESVDDYLDKNKDIITLSILKEFEKSEVILINYCRSQEGKNSCNYYFYRDRLFITSEYENKHCIMTVYKINPITSIDGMTIRDIAPELRKLSGELTRMRKEKRDIGKIIDGIEESMELEPESVPLIKLFNIHMENVEKVTLERKEIRNEVEKLMKYVCSDLFVREK